MKYLTRREARTKAFELIFALKQYMDEPVHMLDTFIDETPEAGKQLSYIRNVVLGVAEKNQELEDVISAHLAKGWTMARLSKTDIAILKLALFEIRYVEDVPDRVAVNEAVELAKLYSDEKSPAFVNGVLASVLKEKAQ